MKPYNFGVSQEKLHRRTYAVLMSTYEQKFVSHFERKFAEYRFLRGYKQMYICYKNNSSCWWSKLKDMPLVLLVRTLFILRNLFT